MTLATLALLALTRAEIVQRMRAPAVTQADGLVRVYANCDEEVRREYQGPVASHAAETVRELYRGLKLKSRRFESPQIVILLGNEHTNVAEVATRVETNGARVVSRIYLKSPAFSDLQRFRTEVARGFYRAVLAKELSEEQAVEALAAADPQHRIKEERRQLAAWLEGRPDRRGRMEPLTEDEVFAEVEANLTRLRKVLEPGVATKKDVLTYASRLYLYPRNLDEKFADGSDVVSFRAAIALAAKDPRVRFLAFFKKTEMTVFAGGRGDYLNDAAQAYVDFLQELARYDKPQDELERLLERADLKLAAAYAQAR